jgi:serine phosphatase RsbU (regulator of sigma subunit)
MSPRSATFHLLAALGLGALLFTAGLILARGRLPEWSPGPLPERTTFVERYQELTGRAGFTPGPAPLSVRLATHENNLTLTCAPPDDPVVAVNTFYGSGVCIEVSQEGTLPGEPTARTLAVEMTADGEPRAVLWTLRKRSALTVRIASPQVSSELQAALLSVLLPSGQSLGPPERGLMGGIAGAIYPLVGKPDEHVFVQISQVGSFLAFREPGEPRTAYLLATGFTLDDAFQFAVPALFILATIALFFILLGRGRIDLLNGAALAALSFLAMLPGVLPLLATAAGALLFRLLHAGLWAVWILVVWSVGESLLRSQRPEAISGLDALRTLRIGPRAGKAVLTGLGYGMGLGGLRLMVSAVAVGLPGLWPMLPSVWLPLFDRWSNPIVQSLTLAGTVALTTALAGRALPARWAPGVAALATALVTMPIPLGPPWAAVAAAWVFAGLLVGLGRRSGLAAVLVAAVSQILLPTMAYAVFRSDWLPGTLTATAAILLAFLGVGIAGLWRSADGEAQRLRPPAFMRRLEEERRIQYEMGLLARMQEGLLPQSSPDIPGWQIAARSILATEAGGDLYDARLDEEGALWIAVGDVAGHGYSCVIVQAMVIAAVSSFIAQGRGPAEVLQNVDRVIRRGRPGQTPRNFTTLALLRIDPQTGEAVLANAGHPYPLLTLRGIPGEPGEVSEIALPGLPLGQGPDRLYREHRFQIPFGSTLLLYSDGLVESCDAGGVPFGFERPREVLRSARRATASDLVDIVTAAWRRHLGDGEPPDDTTVVVLQRVRAAAARV